MRSIKKGKKNLIKIKNKREKENKKQSALQMKSQELCKRFCHLAPRKARENLIGFIYIFMTLKGPPHLHELGIEIIV